MTTWKGSCSRVRPARRRPPARDRALGLVHDVQPRGPGRRRLYAGELALRRASAAIQHRRGHQDPAQEPGVSRHAADPAGLAGHAPGFNGFAPYDRSSRVRSSTSSATPTATAMPARASRGKPLVIRIASTPDQTSRQYAELWQRSLSAVGVKVEFTVQKWPDLFKAARAAQLQMWDLGFTSAVADDFMQNFYGPSARQPRAFPQRGFRRGVSAGAGSPRTTRNVSLSLRKDVRDRRRVRAVVSEGVSHQQHGERAVGQGPQEERLLSVPVMDVPGHRSRKVAMSTAWRMEVPPTSIRTTSNASGA